MPVHLEFVVQGPPVSNQQRNHQGKLNLLTWRAAVTGEAGKTWRKDPLKGPVKAVMINFHQGDQPSVDLDNMSKPILDSLEDVAYEDDRQVRQAVSAHLNLRDSFALSEASILIVNAIKAGDQFVYVRIEDPVEPYPLPG